MHITMLNGNPDESRPEFESYLRELNDVLSLGGHSVTVFRLRDMTIRYCIGCFGCWVKTPGRCSNGHGDMDDICRAYIHSDIVVFASPVIMGFTSALLKKINDRLIPLLHPYISLFSGEMHHIARYDRYPQIGLLVQPGADTDQEDLSIIEDIYRREALNFKTTLAFSARTTQPVEEVADEIDSI